MKKYLLVFLILFSAIGIAQTGIGTTSPVNKFQVEANTADPAISGATDNGNFRLSGVGATHVLDFGLSGSSTFSWLQARSKSTYGTNYNLVFNPNGGNVGIGSTAPTDKLVIGASVAIHDGGNKVIGLGWSPGANTALLTGFPAEIRLDYATGKLSFGTSPNSVALGSSTSIQNVMSLTAQGNVGIGTTAPTTSLHIQNGNTFGSPGSTSSPSIYVYNNNNASSTANATVSVRTAGTGSGKPYYSIDVNGAFGYSMGINNPTDQLILNASWDFNTSAANNAIIINRTGQNRVIIPNSTGGYISDWPGGWGGGLSTYDISCGGVYYTTLFARSDRRLKEKITPLSKLDFDKLLRLNPVNYYWKDKNTESHLQYGLIAQEVEAVFPEMVTTATNEMQTKSINYQALHALNLKAIQVLNEKVEQQKQEIEWLKKEFFKLKRKQKTRK